MLMTRSIGIHGVKKHSRKLARETYPSSYQLWETIGPRTTTTMVETATTTIDMTLSPLLGTSLTWLP